MSFKIRNTAPKITVFTPIVVLPDNTHKPDWLNELIIQNTNATPILINQSHFNSKDRLIINQSGLYKLSENIVIDYVGDEMSLNVHEQRKRFAAIIITANNVEFDLNGCSIIFNEHFSDFETQASIFELGNSPYPTQGTGDPFINSFNFPHIGANKVYIHNGELLKNPHFGIHGVENSYIAIENIEFKDYRVSAISLSKASNQIYLNNLQIVRSIQNTTANLNDLMNIELNRPIDTRYLTGSSEVPNGSMLTAIRINSEFNVHKPTVGLNNLTNLCNNVKIKNITINDVISQVENPKIYTPDGINPASTKSGVLIGSKNICPLNTQLALDQLSDANLTVPSCPISHSNTLNTFDFRGHFLKGTLGVSLVGCYNPSVENLNIVGVKNTGDSDTIACGLSFDNCNGGSANDINISNINMPKGKAVGLLCNNGTINVDVKKCNIKNVNALNSWGIGIINASNVIINDSIIKDIIGTQNSYDVWKDNSSNIKINSLNVDNISS